MRDLGAVQPMTVGPTEDYTAVREILFHPKVFHSRSVVDHVRPEEYRFPSGLYLLAVDEGKPIGFFYFTAVNPILYEVHCAFLPQAWGSKTTQAAKAGLSWLSLHTGCRMLMALVPAFNKPAQAYLERLGAEYQGNIPRGAQKNGKRVPEMIFSLEVPTT